MSGSDLLGVLLVYQLYRSSNEQWSVYVYN